MNQTPPKVIYIIIAAISVLAIMGVATLCLSLFMHTYADAAILTAIITITSNLTGSLMTLLVSPRTSPAPAPVPVKVENPPSDPANVTEVKS